ncbi:hypothetical protein [Nocardia sp. 852002-51244_SCH5132740]|uniref:hypothetical protein n=1 Tax=Nocardia sp. 852002-51244_SCH5132740 TaxID=1834099 RepID=UPI0007EADD2E|nr:hypothetical protein [Nocardia sp. 852002-51244_SCH5132740]OBB34534.1 hypothetical protein A5748_06550 [Nocardia sp. 852002-51244_SCH5132740]
MESVNDNDVRALVLHDPSEEWELRGNFSPPALERADELRGAALGSAAGSEYRCGHGSTYQLSADLPLPQCLSRALSGVQLEAPEGPWPEFGRTEHPIDWPTLIELHPAELTWNYAMLDCNYGADPAAISAAYRLLVTRGHRPWFDVCLWVDPDARIAVEPLALFTATDDDLDPDLADRIDDILVDGGRPRQRLRYDEGPGYWQLDA